MYYPAVGDRVSMRGRTSEYVVVRVDYAACVCDICLFADKRAVEEGVPFKVLFDALEFDHLPGESYAWEDRRRVIKRLLCSSQAHVNLGRALIADTGNLILTTLQAIRSSQEVIGRSDQLIARARTLDCD